MHTIDECPRCKKAFMYHPTDTYLNRDTASNKEIIKNYPIQDDTWTSRRWNEDMTEYEDLSGNYEVICQDCHLTEKWVGKEVKTNHPHFLHLNDFKLIVDSIVTGENYPITVKIGDTDSYEWFDEDELEIINTEIANIAAFIEEKAEHRGWENVEYMSADKFGEENGYTNED